MGMLRESYEKYHSDLMEKKDWMLKRMQHSQSFIQDLLNETSRPHKYFLICKDEKEMADKLSGKIYSIYDTDNNFVGDLFEEDFINFVDKGIIADLTELGKHGELHKRNFDSDYICVQMDEVDNIKQNAVIISFMDDKMCRLLNQNGIIKS